MFRFPGHRHADERGFTIVELLVAMILLGILLAVTFRVLITGFGASNRAVTNDRAMQIASHSAESLGSDLRRARAMHRDTLYIREITLLFQAVRYGTLIRNPDAPPTYLDVRDVLIAQPHVFTFQSDVLPDYPTVRPRRPTPECVTYYSPGWDAPTWYLRRVVQRYAPGCANPAVPPTGLTNFTGLPGLTTVMRDDIVEKMKNPSTRRTAPAPLFSYVRTYQDGPRGVCNTAPVSSSTSRYVLDHLTAIRIDLRSLVARNDTMARNELRPTVSVRTRMNWDYQYAMGCVFR